MKMVSTNLIIY